MAKREIIKKKGRFQIVKETLTQLPLEDKPKKIYKLELGNPKCSTHKNMVEYEWNYITHSVSLTKIKRLMKLLSEPLDNWNDYDFLLETMCVVSKDYYKQY